MDTENTSIEPGSNETVEQVCKEMRSFEDVPPPRFAWRDLTDRAEAAHKREIAAKDEVIESLKAKNIYIFNATTIRDGMIKKRDDLIRELTNVLYEEISWIDDAIGIAFPTVKPNNTAKIRALIAKAKEVLG